MREGDDSRGRDEGADRRVVARHRQTKPGAKHRGPGSHRSVLQQERNTQDVHYVYLRFRLRLSLSVISRMVIRSILTNINIYRPQGKVMFSQCVSFCPQSESCLLGHCSSLLATRSLVTVRSVRILLECFLVTIFIFTTELPFGRFA